MHVYQRAIVADCDAQEPEMSGHECERRLAGTTTLQLNLLPCMKYMAKLRILYPDKADAQVMRDNDISSYHWRMVI